jgi:hypothetical protein
MAPILRKEASGPHSHKKKTLAPSTNRTTVVESVSQSPRHGFNPSLLRNDSYILRAVLNLAPLCAVTILAEVNIIVCPVSREAGWHSKLTGSAIYRTAKHAVKQTLEFPRSNALELSGCY